ncbi:uncharacterized protein LAESUDRAFT_517209 [Laetiporus sulphureus 93-53]|uniref:Uncharacterized protein n=1 Tax=Laetiporus sulphureus 93-53 TaxID=1314785 RepID=A0A165G1L7_9APHY|nr:uncharacterized protein LAESUDRAFT_517209 [Laetiporus sulphureus 93-53]KZT09707.1 hypothetical protein LAESUDRAFT_517209 [Laetiporus sulphureus 93-53]
MSQHRNITQNSPSPPLGTELETLAQEGQPQKDRSEPATASPSLVQLYTTVLENQFKLRRYQLVVDAMTMELEAKQDISKILVSLNALMGESVAARQHDTAILAKLNNQSDELLKRVQETPAQHRKRVPLLRACKAQKLKMVYMFDKVTRADALREQRINALKEDDAACSQHTKDLHRLRLLIQEAVSLGKLNALEEELRELDQAFHS